jgi:hypothetical protein
MKRHAVKAYGGSGCLYTLRLKKQLQVNFTLHAILKEPRAELIFAGMEMQWDEGGGRILLDDNRSCCGYIISAWYQRTEDMYWLVICILYSEVLLNLTEVSLTLTEVFPCFFLSCKANARVKLAKTGHGPHSSTLVVICVVRLLFLLVYVLFVCKCLLPPGDKPVAVNNYIIQEMKTWTE